MPLKLFNRSIVGKPVRSAQRQERTSFAVGFALVAGAALATSASLLLSRSAPPEQQLKSPEHVEAVEARAGAVPELDESIAVYLPHEGAVLGLPLEPPAKPAERGARAAQKQLAPEPAAPPAPDAADDWSGLPAFAEATATALEAEIGEDQIWAPVSTAAEVAKPTRDIWPWVWIPTAVAMPFLLAHKSGGGSGGSGGTANGASGGTTTLPDPPGDLPSPSSTGGGSGAGTQPETPPSSGGGAGSLPGGGEIPDVPAPSLDEPPVPPPPPPGGSNAGGDPNGVLVAVADDVGGPGSFGGGGGDFGGDQRDLLDMQAARFAAPAPLFASDAAAPVPEPGSLALFAAGALVLGLALRRAR